MVMRVSPEHTE